MLIWRPRSRSISTAQLSSRAEVTVVCQKERHSELAEESRSRQQAARMNRARFLGKLGMTFFFIRLLVRDYLIRFSIEVEMLRLRGRQMSMTSFS
ncbi:hypothetical protein [Hymenobacter frigidus]|uniref:hypothetical protein n=1 Tax=Hymenobacter frigidus TaxID=1524095 RepID=UPI00166386B2|nr:hypothetical protein [Hymenobacter frigidus]